MDSRELKAIYNQKTAADQSTSPERQRQRTDIEDVKLPPIKGADLVQRKPSLTTSPNRPINKHLSVQQPREVNNLRMNLLQADLNKNKSKTIDSAKSKNSDPSVSVGSVVAAHQPTPMSYSEQAHQIGKMLNKSGIPSSVQRDPQYCLA